MIKKLILCWGILTGKKYWAFYVSRKKEYLTSVSDGWNASEARMIAKDVHRKTFQADREKSAVDEAKNIINEGSNPV